MITSFYLTSPKGDKQHTNVTHLQMRSLSLEDITKYVDTDRAFDCAGGYKLEQAGICLFSKIKTQDQTAILGLPLIELSSCIWQLCGRWPYSLGD